MKTFGGFSVVAIEGGVKEQVWAFVDVLGWFVCMYVQGFCGVVGGVVWKKREAGSDVGLGLGLGLGGAIFIFLISGFIRNVPISCYLSYRHSISIARWYLFLLDDIVSRLSLRSQPALKDKSA